MNKKPILLSLVLVVGCSSSSSSQEPDSAVEKDAVVADSKTDIIDPGPDAIEKDGDIGDGDAAVDVKPQIDPDAIVINEVAAKGKPEDWFELYNRSDKAVNLEGYTFSDDKKRKTFSPFPEGSIIPPGGYLVIQLTDDYPGFKLAVDEMVVLATSDGEVLDEVDLSQFAVSANNSVGRLPNGTGEFKLLGFPTPGKPNFEGTDDAVIPEGYCPQGPWQCPDGKGCVQGVCGSCYSDDDCGPEDRCQDDGSCGPCSDTKPCDKGRTCRHGFCVPEELPHWTLTIDPWAWGEMNIDPWNVYFSTPCSLGVGTTAYTDTCDLKIHGGSSRDFPKKSLRITFDENKPHPGFSRKIILRAEYNDASFIRNVLSYAVFRRLSLLPTPRTRYVKVDINGEHYGLFVEVMRIGPKFLKTAGRSSDAQTYEADDDLESATDGSGTFVPLPDVSTYAATYAAKTGDENDYSTLIDLIENQVWKDYQDYVKGIPISRVPKAVYFDSFVTYLAIMAAIQNGDHVRKNQIFSLQPASNGTPRWEFYPWDLDLTFGCAWNDEAENTICDQVTLAQCYNEGIIEDGYTPSYTNDGYYNVLIHLALADSVWSVIYEERICEIINSHFWTKRLHDYIDALAEMISSAVQADPNDRNADLASFNAAVQEVHWATDQHEAFLRNELSCPAPPP